MTTLTESRSGANSLHPPGRVKAREDLERLRSMNDTKKQSFLGSSAQQAVSTRTRLASSHSGPAGPSWLGRQRHYPPTPGSPCCYVRESLFASPARWLGTSPTKGSWRRQTSEDADPSSEESKHTRSWAVVSKPRSWVPGTIAPKTPLSASHALADRMQVLQMAEHNNAK